MLIKCGQSKKTSRIVLLYNAQLDRKRAPILEIGLVGIALGYALVGPTTVVRTLLGWQAQQLWLVYVSEVLMGGFFCTVLVQTFQMSEDAFE